jgi:hypothetical protein
MARAVDVTSTNGLSDSLGNIHALLLRVRHDSRVKEGSRLSGWSRGASWTTPGGGCRGGRKLQASCAMVGMCMIFGEERNKLSVCKQCDIFCWLYNCVDLIINLTIEIGYVL